MENEKTVDIEQTEVKAEAPKEVVSDERDKQLEKYKRLLDKANSEAADYKRQLRAKQSEDEIAEQERAEHQKAIENELAELKKQNTIGGYKLNFMKAGFDEDTATKTSQALANGDTETLFANLLTLSDSISKSALAKAMENQKGLSVGNTVTQADIEKANNEALRKAFGLR